MTTVKQRMQDELTNMLNHYRTHPRAMTDKAACRYFIPNDSEPLCCAIGRRCADPAAVENAFKGKGILHIHNLDSYLMEDARGLPKSFWCDLQKLHDGDRYWGDDYKGGNELTLEGLLRVESIRGRIETGVYETINQFDPERLF